VIVIELVLVVWLAGVVVVLAALVGCAGALVCTGTGGCQLPL
jgi:hypothetical protein